LIKSNKSVIICLMTTPVLITTNRENLVLRELATEADDLAYFAAIDSNRDHLSQFGDETANNYPNLEAVEEARLHPSNPDKLRLGIWDADTFVGSINLTPDDNGEAEIGYWLDGRYTGKGYATLATQALAQYGIGKFERIYANVVEGNEASAGVLERAGFRQIAKEAGKLAFELSAVKKPEPKATPIQQLTDRENLERFAELPSRREALRAKDKDNLTVFLSLAIAKKLYRCPCCRGDINIGSEHVILSRVQMSKRYTHHHIDFQCTQDEILPTLTNIQSINPNEATASAVNARSRKYRNKKRRH
jgi:RimJ/RimL family protein N-acetyltransferase